MKWRDRETLQIKKIFAFPRLKIIIPELEPGPSEAEVSIEKKEEGRRRQKEEGGGRDKPRISRGKSKKCEESIK